MKKKVFSLMMMLLLAFMGVAKAETIEIGDGTGTSYYGPYNSLYEYSFVEQIYTASEIGGGGTITAISFNMQSTDSQTNQVDVFMKNVSRSTFSNNNDYEPVTASDMVFSGTVTFSSGWTTITLDTPFAYDGSSNLMIGMHEYTPGYSTRYFYYTDVENSILSYYSDSYNPDPYDLGSYSGTKFATYRRPNIQIEMTAGGGGEAATLLVNDGTETNGYVPVYGFYADAYNKTEMVYPASTLSAMNGGTINGMTFYASNADVSWGSANFQVFVSEVSDATISSFYGPGTVVYEGPLSIVNNEMAVNFTTSYPYNGGNLLVGVYQTATGSYVSCSWYGVTVNGASIHEYNYNGLSSITTGTQRNFLPKTNFAYTTAGGGGGGGGFEDKLHVKYMDGETEVIDTLNLGVRPAGAWMEPFNFTMYSEGPTYTVNVLDFTPSDGMFSVEGEELPFQVNTDGVELVMNVNTADTGVIERQFVAITEGDRAAHIWPVIVELYLPECPDVVEVAYDLGTVTPGFTYAGAPAEITPTVLHNDYTLPFPEIPEGEDGVYKFTVENDVIISAYVGDGQENALENGKVALYTEDFYGEGGPMATNNYTGLSASGSGAAAGPFEALIGDPASTSTTGYNPMYYLYNYSLSTAIYTAAELAEAGATTAPMTSVSWFSNSTYGYNIQNVSIWMANVSDNEVSTMSPLGSGMTLVYEGNHQEVVGENEFVLNQGSFAWDGTSNVIVMVQMNNGSWSSSIQWQCSNPGFNAMSYAYTDNAPYNAQTTSYSMYTSNTARGNILFKGGNRDRAGRDLIDFEDGNFPPEGWTYYGYSESWYVDTEDFWGYAPAYAGNYSLYIDGNGNYDSDYLVSPALEFDGSAASVSFAYSTPDWSGDYNDLSVVYGTSPTGPWTYTSFMYASSDGWTTATVDLSSLNGTYYIAFESYDGYGYCTAIDNINITGTSSGGGDTPTPTPGPAMEGVSAGPVISNLGLTAGTYYLVASAAEVEEGRVDGGENEENFFVYINIDQMPCPAIEAEGFAFSPEPADDADEIEPASVTLRWMVPEYATGWRLVFGSTYYPDPNHPQTIMYPEDGSFSNEMANSYTVRNLWNNTNYFWHVEFNNDACPDGVSSPIWGFTTHLNIPQNLTVVDETVFNDEQIVLNWTPVVDRTYRYYFIYRDGEKIGETTVNQINLSTYTDGPLAYNMDGYTYYVTAVYDEGESAPSNTVTVKVSGRGNVNGHVYEQDGTTGIAGATVTMVGPDEFGVNHTYNFTTDAQGYYSGAVYAGPGYDGQAAKEGYQTAYVPVQGEPIVITYNQTTSPIDYIMDENFDPVCAVIAEYYPDSLDPNSPYVKVYWGCGLPGSEIIEDFETGDFSLFDWQVDANYPWTVTTYQPYEGTYCMKSGGAGVNNVISNMSVSVEIPADGLMSFFSKISCESSWDYGYFYIDGAQMGSYTGAGNWGEREFPVTAGTHTFMWQYTKDGSVNSNDDCFYVDYITFYKQPAPPIPGMTYDFDNSTMQGWTNIDADGDGKVWAVGSTLMSGVAGHNGSADFVFSQSYDNSYGVLYPDNYLVSPQVELGGTLTFYACAQDASYAAEHFGVAVSTTSNTSPSAFTMLQEWTMTAKSAPMPKKAQFDATSDVKGMGHSRGGNNRDQGNWYQYTVDLSAYSGMGYVAIRHFNCNDMFYLDVDDITIGEPAKSVAQTRSLDHYRVYRTNCYQECPFTEENTVLLATVWVPDTVYIDVEWADLEPGVYKWGVGAVYSGNRGEMIEAPINWTAPQAVNMTRSFGTAEANQNGPKIEMEMPAPTDNRDYLQYCTEAFEGGVGTGGGAVYWGIRFPAADLTAYAGQTLTKVGVFMDIDGDYGWTYSGNYTARVYQGGATAPGTLVSEATEYLPGDMAWHDITLTTPVTIDATQDLWLTFYTPDIAYPMSGCAYTGEPNSDFLSLDGITWDHSTDYALDYTWMIRGLVENGGTPGPGPGPTPGPGTNNCNELALARESETIWSNCLDKDMYIIGENQDGVTVNVLLNSADSPEGVQVTFTNYNEAEQELYPIEPIVLDETGFYAFDSFRRGNYKVNVTFDGYEPIEDSVSIWNPVDLRYVMIEIIYGVSDLYVSSTGWAMWAAEGMPTPGGGGGGGGGQGGGDSFTDDFENGIVNWTLIDADGDGNNWYDLIGNNPNNIPGHNGSAGFATSASWNGSVLYPDNYLVSQQVTLGGTFSFWACAQDAGYPDETFGVCVSTSGNSNASDFTMLNQWTLTAKSVGAKAGETRSGNRDQGAWYQYTVDLSAYAGQSGYVAIRHFNCPDRFRINVDDVEMSSGAKSGDRHLEYFKVMCESLDHEPIFNANVPADQPFCQVATEELVAGEHYIAKVAAMYSTGMSAWSECEWQYIPCENYAGTVNGVEVNGTEISWEYPGGSGPVPPVPPVPGDVATVVLSTPVDIWGDGSGYQMFLDADHTVAVDLPTGNFGGSIPAATLAEFEYSIPENADGNINGQNVISATGTNMGSVEVPAGMYDILVVNPDGSNVWVVGNGGQYTGVTDDFVFEGGKTYTFTIVGSTSGDGLDLVVTDTRGNVVAVSNNGRIVRITDGRFDGSAVGAKGNRAAWDLMMTFTAPEAGHYGVAYDGNNFYTSNWGYSSAAHNFYKYDLQGNMLEGFEIAGCGTLRGITYDGTNFYGVANSNTVYCVDLANHSVINTFTTSYGAMRGITYDPARDGFWVIGNWTGNLTLIDRTGAIVQTGPMPESASDLAYYKDENDVEHVFCFNNADNGVYDYNITTNTLGGSVFNFSAVPGFNAGSSGGCTVGSFNGKIAFIGDIQQDPNLIGIYELRDDNAGPQPPVPPATGEIIGAMIFVDGEWVAEVPYPTNTYTYEGEGEEVCVRIIYNGTNNLPEGNIYYSMSCPECEALEPGVATCEPGAPIHSELVDANHIKVWWGNAPAAPVSDWLYYDDGTNEDAIGLTSGGSFYWGIKFPAAAMSQYEGCSVTKIGYFDYTAHTGTVRIYNGSNGTAPGTLIGTYNYTANGTSDWVEWSIPAVAFDNTQDLWIVMNNANGQYVAALGPYTGDPNGTMLSTDGSAWSTLADATGGQLSGTWNLRCYVTNQAKGGEIVALDDELNGTPGGVIGNAGVSKHGEAPAYMTRAELVKYNVYRSTEANGTYTLIGEVAEDGSGYYEYIDSPTQAGTYYYQVRAEYDNECESEPAQAADDPSVNYVSETTTAQGVDENGSNVALYPNPTKGNVTIEAEGMSRITVVSVLGQVVFDTELDADQYTLNMSQFNAGMYMVRVYTEGGVTVKRVTVMQ